MKIISALLLALSLSACAPGADSNSGSAVPAPVPPNNLTTVDNSVVRGTAYITITKPESATANKILPSDLLSSMFATSTGSTTVTYNNAPLVNFTINTAALVAGAMTGNTLSLGSVSISALKDNNLKVCNPGGNSKCTTAIIRVYTTGTIPGFVNTTDTPNYGVPVYASGLNPTTPLILNSPGTAVQQLTGISVNKHVVLLSDFPTPTYNITADFSNAGSGSYSMTFVVEYALAP